METFKIRKHYHRKQHKAVINGDFLSITMKMPIIKDSSIAQKLRFEHVRTCDTTTICPDFLEFSSFLCFIVLMAPVLLIPQLTNQNKEN